MATMYDFIMDLPLFRGISREQVSGFLERTNIEIVNFEAGDAILDKEEEMNSLLFIISGKARVTLPFHNNNIKVSYTLGTGDVIAAEFLFGIMRKVPYDCIAMEKVALLRITKTQYISLLGQNNIYLFNFVNFLSRNCQNALEAAREIAPLTLESWLSLVMNNCVGCQTATDITVEFTLEELEKALNTDSHCLISQVKGLEQRGMIRYDVNSILILAPRRNFMAGRE